MAQIENKPLLSICIPTWNRAEILKESLRRLSQEVRKVNISEVELLISDNHSDDNTMEVVMDYIDKGLPVIYNRNSDNIGADRNFLYCMKHASGKYILLLGDDDYFCTNALKYLLDIIRDKEYGLIHIRKYPKTEREYWVYDNQECFLKCVTFWITFMSGNIFRRDIVDTIDYNKYLGSFLLQVPYFIASALSEKTNIIINNKSLMLTGVDYINNREYNPYEIFIKNYLKIWSGFRNEEKVSKSLFSFIKRDLYMNFLIKHNVNLLVLKKNVADDLKKNKGYKIAGAKELLKEYYGRTWYYYASSIIMFWKALIIIIKGIVKIYLCRE